MLPPRRKPVKRGKNRPNCHPPRPEFPAQLSPPVERNYNKNLLAELRIRTTTNLDPEGTRNSVLILFNQSPRERKIKTRRDSLHLGSRPSSPSLISSLGQPPDSWNS